MPPQNLNLTINIPRGMFQNHSLLLGISFPICISLLTSVPFEHIYSPVVNASLHACLFLILNIFIFFQSWRLSVQ